MSEIAYPNVDYDSLYYTQNSFVFRNLTFDRFKDLDGVKVAYPSYEGNYSLIGAFRDPTGEGLSFVSLRDLYANPTSKISGLQYQCQRDKG